MFNESIYAFQVYHVMNFLPYLSRKVKEWKKFVTERQSLLMSRSKKIESEIKFDWMCESEGIAALELGSR